MRFGSLFAGIGGIDLGLERAGMECVWQVEIDDYCQRVLARHFPDATRFRDVRDCHGIAACAMADATITNRSHEGLSVGPAVTPYRWATETVRSRGCAGCLPPVDLICGGFPCQPVSHAGKRKGDKDERWLWPEFLRIIREVRPRWVLAENVPGLLSVDPGRLFGGILRDLAESGYDAEWDIVSAADVGAPHLRERVFIVAHADTGGRVGWPRVFGQGWRGEPTDGDWWSVECRLGIPSHGLSGGLDCAGWECGVPRVIKGQWGRVNRLRALGNAVVPQVAEYVGRLIMESERTRRGQR